MAKIEVKYYLGGKLSVSTDSATFFFSCTHGRIRDDKGNLIYENIEDYVVQNMTTLDKSLVEDMVSVLTKEIKECANK